MTDKARAHFAIDLHGEFPCSVVQSADGKPRLRIELGNAELDTFPRTLYQHLELAHGKESRGPVSPISDLGRRVRVESNGHQRTENEGYRRIDFSLPTNAQDGDHVTLKLLGKSVLTLDHVHGAWATAADTMIVQLAPSEIRALGMQLREDVLPKFPYSREARQGFDAGKHAPITDLHTHMSAEISAKDLFDIALETSTGNPAKGIEPNNTIAYPVELLNLIGAGPTEKQIERGQVIQVASRGFNPLRAEGLKCEQDGQMCNAIRLRDLTPNQRERVTNQMRVMPDQCTLPTHFDRELYRFRNPFSKHPDLTKAVIKKQAEAYAKMGVEYATLSTSSMLDPAWFSQMVEAVDEIERDGVMVDGVKKAMHLRFLVGVPRNITPEETFVALNKIKFLAQHPYIVGMDMNGYESNKTSQFFWALAHMGRWARDSFANPEDAKWDFKDKFIMQVHAGETSKNQANVGRAIALAQHYDVRVMVGHYLHADLKENETRWLKDIKNKGVQALQKWEEDPASVPSDKLDKFIMQMCPDSNQGFNAKRLVHHSPIKERMKQGQCVLSSDGGGMLGLSPRGLAYSAIAAGVSLQQLEQLQAYERGFIDRQKVREAKNRKTFTQEHGAERTGNESFVAAYKKHCVQYPHPRDPEKFAKFLPKEFDEKTPLFIGGAAGSSWGQLEKLDQWEIEQFMDFLVEVIDPKKCYFVLGRVQNDGVSKSLDIAINRHNKLHPKAPFSVLGRYAGKPTGDLPETITWLQPILGDQNIAASDMIEFLQKKNGKALLFPGQDYTAEMIIGANNEDNPVANAFMVPRPHKRGDDVGKIYELAETMPAATQFMSDHSLPLSQVGKQNGAIDAFIDRIMQPGSPFISDEADRASILRDGVDMHAEKEKALSIWLKSHIGKPSFGNALKEMTSPMNSGRG
ncbi:MAG: hypothetical protein ACOYNL_00200 [Rickettsiales bacterium]